MATDIPAGFLEARYPWMNIQGNEGYPSRDFLYLILALWNRTGGTQGSSSGSSSQTALNFFTAWNESDSSGDEFVTFAPRTFTGGWFDEKGSGGTYGFAAGVDFTAGTTTSLTLSQPYGSQANLIIAFDGTWQGADQFSVSGKTLTFTSVIPVGVSKVYVKGFLMPQ